MQIDSGPVSAEQLGREPHRLAELTTTEKYSFSAETLADIQLAGLRTRFNELIDAMPVLARFADANGLKEVGSLEDGALLLFPHTLYKSYPLSAIEKNRFDVLTRWLGSLTVVDLSAVEATPCESLDDWVIALDTKSEVRLKHSSGTTGKLSFIPANTAESRTAAIYFLRKLQGFGDEPDASLDGVVGLPVISLAARKGAMAASRQVDVIVEHLYNGDESKIYSLNPGRVSADLLSLGGRLEGAAAKGELGKLQLAPGLLARRDEFIRQQADQGAMMRRFYERIEAELKGQRVIVSGILTALVDTSVQGLDWGYERMFSPDTLLSVAGGTKGRVLPPDYKEQVERFTGAPFPLVGFGQSEGVATVARMCPQGYYHVGPNIIAYLLDPVTGELLPRTGTQKGRYGFIDLAARLRWGGFLTSDEVTIHWGDTQPCTCGRKGAYTEPDIRRYSESEGGDDKITCAGATGVHDKALDLIANIVG